MLTNLKYLIKTSALGLIISCGQNTPDSDLQGVTGPETTENQSTLYEVKVEIENASSIDFELFNLAKRSALKGEDLQSTGSFAASSVDVPIGTYKYAIEAVVDGVLYATSSCGEHAPGVFVYGDTQQTERLCSLGRKSFIDVDVYVTKIQEKETPITSDKVEPVKSDTSFPGGRWRRVSTL